MQYLTFPLFHYSLLRLCSVLRAEDASALPRSTSTGPGLTTPSPGPTTPSPDLTTPSSGPIPPGPKPNTLPLAVGLTLGLLIPALLVLGIFYLRRRKRRNLELRGRRRATPLRHIPLEKGDQLSGPSPESKRRPQPTQPSTHGSTVSSSAPTTTAVPTTSNGTPESGMSPSHSSLRLPGGQGGLERLPK